MSGYIKLNRRFFEHPFWREERIFSPAEAWIDLIASARFEAEPLKELVKMNMIQINRGELRASQRYLAKRWSWSLGRVNTFIKLLCDERMIERRVEHGETIVIVSKYNEYNSKTQGESEQQEERETEQPLNVRRTDGERPLNKTNKRKEREEGKEVSNPLSLSEIPKPEKKAKEQALQFPFCSPRFLEAWNRLVALDKWKKKPISSLNMSLAMLGRYEEDYAVILVEKAVSGNYQGVVFNDTDQAYSRWLKSKETGKILTPQSEEKKAKLIDKLG